MSTPAAEKIPGAKPILRAVTKTDDDRKIETAVFWPAGNSDNDRFVAQGKLVIEGRRQDAFMFVNERKDGSGVFLSVTTPHTDEQTGEIGYKQIAIGNVVNQRADNKESYFDTILLNPTTPTGEKLEGAMPIPVYVQDALSDELHTKLGFAHARVARPEQPKSTAAAPRP